MSRTLKLFYTTLHLQGVEGRGSLLERKSPSTAQLGQCRAAEGMAGYGQLSGGFSMGINSFLVPSITSIVVVNIHFLISLLFPVNFSYLTVGSLPFVPPILLSLPLQKEGERENEGHMVSGGALNCGVPFLNMTYST